MLATCATAMASASVAKLRFLRQMERRVRMGREIRGVPGKWKENLSALPRSDGEDIGRF